MLRHVTSVRNIGYFSLSPFVRVLNYVLRRKKSKIKNFLVSLIIPIDLSSQDSSPIAFEQNYKTKKKDVHFLVSVYQHKKNPNSRTQII